MMLSDDEAPANFVPAAAVKRRGRVLFVMTGRKGYVGCSSYFISKYHRETCGSLLLTLSWSDRSVLAGVLV